MACNGLWIRPLGLLLTGLLFLFLAGCRPVSQTGSHSCKRIVSLSPSITETVYALNLDQQLVGVTRFCRYPEEARKKPSIGGYLDPDMEAIVRLQPDLLLVRKEQSDMQGYLANFNLPTLSVEHRTVPGILQSFRRIGTTCNRTQEAEKLIAALEKEITRIQKLTKDVSYRPRVMVAVDRDLRQSSIRQVYIAGQDGFYDWMIEQAGGESVIQDHPGFLQVSPEGILRLNPDIIIEIVPDLTGSGITHQQMTRQWQALQRVSAVRKNRIHVLEGDYLVVPGPRFVQTLKAFARILHPELKWDASHAS